MDENPRPREKGPPAAQEAEPNPEPTLGLVHTATLRARGQGLQTPIFIHPREELLS